MKTFKKIFISCLVIVAFSAFVGKAEALTLSQTSISLTVGQTSTVTAYSDNYYSSTASYLSGNSNPNIATATVNGNIVSIYGVSTGGTTLTLCQSYNNSSCATIYVTVNGYNYNNGTSSNSNLSISNITLSVGSSITISPSNNYYNNYYNYSNTTGLYVSSNSNPSVASTAASSSGCYGTNTYNTITGQLCNVTYNNYNNYTYSNYSYTQGCYGTNQFSTTTGQSCNGSSNSNGSSIVITALSAGSDTISVCQSGGTCNTINVTVTGYSTPINSYYSTSNYDSTYSGIPTIYSNSSAN